jgi:hypothetical protein
LADDAGSDYWGLGEARSESQVTQFHEWYEKQCAILLYLSFPRYYVLVNKKKWDFQEELKKYCLMDVVVLAEVVKAYRNKVMSFEPVNAFDYPDSTVPWVIPKLDPFQFMTLPQISMQTLVPWNDAETSYDNYGFTGITSFYQPHRPSRCPEAILWLRRCADLEGGVLFYQEKIVIENFMKFNLQMGFDGYAPYDPIQSMFF